MKEFLKHIPFIGFLLCVFFLAAIMFSKHLQSKQHITMLPPIELEGLSYQDILQNAPVVVNFFASWCASCKKEHDKLMALYNQDIPIYGVVWNDKPQEIDTFLEKHGNPYIKLGYDTKSSAIVQMGIKGLPETFVVGKSGKILAHRRGELNHRFNEQYILPYFQ